jgi:hypothetical protein
MPLVVALRAVLALSAAGVLATAPQAPALSLSRPLTVTGEVASPAACDLASLQALLPTTQTVSFLAARVPQTHAFVGTGALGPLDRSGIVTGTGGFPRAVRTCSRC